MASTQYNYSTKRTEEIRNTTLGSNANPLAQRELAQRRG